MDAVNGALSQGDLATGYIVEQYEREFASMHGYAHGVATNSGTSALWCAYKALGVRKGTEVITSPLTFSATANMIVALGGRPVFADVDARTLNITQRTVAEKVTSRTKLIVPVDYGGQLSNVHEHIKVPVGLRRQTPRTGAGYRVSNIPIVVDAAHSVGVRSGIGIIRCYSTHAAKNMTTCEGGMVLTNDSELAQCVRTLRNHGMDSTPTTRKGHVYDIETIGFNFRMPDPLAALGLSQLRKVREFNTTRALIRTQYDTAFLGEPGIILRGGETPTANHLYVIMLDLGLLVCDRDEIFEQLRAAGVGVNVHYRPVYLFRAYRRMGYEPGLCPNAEWAYERLLTLPLYPTMTQQDTEHVIKTVKQTIRGSVK
jgi:perosamine synthetase